MFGIYRPHFWAKALFLFLVVISCARIPDHIGEWRVEVGPAGNEYCLTPEPLEENPRPPEKLLSVIRELAPSHMDVSSWHLRHDDMYWIRVEAGPDRYDYHIALDGTLREITYTNTSTHAREKAYALVIKGAKKSIPLEEVPSEALKTLAIAFPGTKPRETWIASTIAGPRYVIVVGEMAFYARPDGQIQSARLISEGALEENYPTDGSRDAMVEEILSEASEFLDEYRERFNFEDQVRRLTDRRKGSHAPFRFVVMGDSRSNSDLWLNMVKHISLLDPQPDFIINTGDLVPRGFPGEFREYFIPPLLDLDIPYFVAIGNHDYGFDHKAIEYRYLFGENALSYYFDYSGHRFIFIDNVTSVRPVDETIEWLDRVLSGTPADLDIIVVVHRPFGNIEKWAYHAMNKEPSKAITDLMSQYDVKHVFCGHIHAYSTITFGGVDYTVSGGSGAGLHDRFGPLGSVHHYIICDVGRSGALNQQVVRFYKME